MRLLFLGFARAVFAITKAVSFLCLKAPSFALPSVPAFLAASMGVTFAARAAGFPTDICTTRKPKIPAITAVRRALGRLQPSGSRKYAIIPPAIRPAGTENALKRKPSRRTIFFICFCVIPMV